MKRQPHPLAGLLRGFLSPRDRRSEAGDTLIEVLVTLIILSICVLAIIVCFATAITASADHRSLAVNGTVLHNIDQSAFYQLQQQPQPQFLGCAKIADYSPGGSNAISFNPPTGYKASVAQVQYWNGTSFLPPGSACPSSSAPQLITLTVTNPNGSTATTQTAVDGVGVSPVSVSVTGVSPASASQGAANSNLLLTITGTGFVSGDQIKFPLASGIRVSGQLAGTAGAASFVSTTTLTAFVDLTNAVAGSYTISVADSSGSTLATSSRALFTVVAFKIAGMHVGSTATNLADPAKDDPDESTTGWDAWLTITVVSGNNAPLQGAVINGSWNLSGFNGITTCTTDDTGSCTVYLGYADQLPHNQSPLPVFTLSKTVSNDPTVGGIVLAGSTYDGSGGSWTVPVPT